MFAGYLICVPLLIMCSHKSSPYIKSILMTWHQQIKFNNDKCKILHVRKVIQNATILWMAGSFHIYRGRKISGSFC